MAGLTGYFDAAGDNAGEHAVTVGGYVSPVRSWSRFKRDWRKVLDPLNIGVFHMTDFVAGEGQFSEWKNKPKEQMAVLKRLAKVIVRHAHFSPASTVRLDHWRAVNREYTLKECHATPYAMASFSVLNKSIKWIGREHPHDHLMEFVYEEGDTGRGDFLHFMDWVREVARNKLAPEAYPVFKPKTLDPLQAADFAVWEQRFVAARRIQGFTDGFRESMGILVSLNRRNEWGLVDEKRLIEWCDWLGVPKRDASVRLSQKARARWRPAPFAKRLKQRRRQP